MEEEEEEVEEGAPAWMATFSDLATLLLTFFVLLLSFAKTDVHNFKKMMGSVQAAFGVTFEAAGEYEAVSHTPIEVSQVPTSDRLEQVVPQKYEEVDKVREIIKKAGLEEDVEVKGSPRGTIVRVKDAVLFDTGRDKIKEEGKPSLDVIAKIFQEMDGDMSIEGHTDNVPIASGRFPSNWELSSARATAVLRYLTDDRGLDMARMHIAGYADQRPVVPHDTEENRSRNRRVEFVFEHKLPLEQVDEDGNPIADQEGEKADDAEPKEAKQTGGAGGAGSLAKTAAGGAVNDGAGKPNAGDVGGADTD